MPALLGGFVRAVPAVKASAQVLAREDTGVMHLVHMGYQMTLCHELVHTPRFLIIHATSLVATCRLCIARHP